MKEKLQQAMQILGMTEMKMNGAGCVAISNVMQLIQQVLVELEKASQVEATEG